MRIAHVLSSLRVGGGERVALELAGGQVALGHSVVAVSLADELGGPLAADFKARGAEVVNVPKTGTDWALPLRLARLFFGLRVDLVHTHNRAPLIYAAAPGKLAGARVVHTRHGPGRGTWKETCLRRAAGLAVDGYVAVSPELAALAQELRDCAAERISVIENGIDLDRFERSDSARCDIRKALSIPDSAFVIGSVGRLAREKDYPLLVRAAAPLLGPETRLVIVGSGDEKETIQKEVARCGVESYVSLPGGSNDVPGYLAAFDVFVLSSRMEGLPLVALEAMAAGLPLLSTAVGGLPTLIEEGVTGLLTPSGNEETMRQRLRSVKDDLARAQDIGRRGRAHVRARYSHRVMLDRYEKLYLQVRKRERRA